MKIQLWTLVVIVALAGALFLLQQDSRSRGNGIQILYDAAIPRLAITTVQMRQLTVEGKKQAFEEFRPQFTIEKAIKTIQNTVTNPQLILWFTNHAGQIPQKGASWYKAQVFEKLISPGTTFWLADLAAWQVLCTNENESLTKPNGRLLTRSSNALTCNTNRSYALLKSTDFFNWLEQLPISITRLDPKLADGIVRADLRPKGSRFSLKQIGYCPLFLEIFSPKLGTTLVEADHSQVFPLLQYLEGVYYVLKIVEYHSNIGSKECDIVFLLPNKEFKYYLVPGEEVPFATFKRTIDLFLKQQLFSDKLPLIKIHFYPFSYGKGFYDQPCEEDGPYLKGLQC